MTTSHLPKGKKRPKWAEVAKRFARGHLPASAWTAKDIKALAALLGLTAMRSYGDGFNKGYQQGHDDQMKFRVAEALEKAPRRTP